MSLIPSRVKLEKRVPAQFNGFVHRRIQTQVQQYQPLKVSFTTQDMKPLQQKPIVRKSLSKMNKTKISSVRLDIILSNFGEKSKIRKINFDFHKHKQNGIQNQSGISKISRQKDKRKKTSFLVQKSRSQLEGLMNQDNSLSKASLLIPQFDTELLKIEVKKICECLEELKNFGLAQKKLHSWCKKYFDSKKKKLIDIFMRKFIKRKSLNDELTFTVIGKEEHLLNNVVEAAIGLSQKERQSLVVEIGLYRNFLEEKIANKQRLELNQLEHRVRNNVEQPQNKQLARQLYKQETLSTEMVSFYSDMQRIEQAYGPLSLISIKNRKRYENINKSELNIRKIIYD